MRLSNTKDVYLLLLKTSLAWVACFVFLVLINRVSDMITDCVIHVVVCLPRPIEGMGRDLLKEWGDSNFQIFFYRTASSTTGSWSRWTILMFIYIYIYHSEHYGLILEDTILFLQGLLFFYFCVHFHFLQVHCACVLCI